MTLQKAAIEAELALGTATSIQNTIGMVIAKHAEEGLPRPTIDEQIARKAGSGRPKVLGDGDCQQIFNACTSSNAQRKKKLHNLLQEEGFNACRRTIETRMRKMNLYRTKSTKKLALTDIQKAQRYKIALSRQHWGYKEWSMVIFSDEASILVGEHRGKQKISKTLDVTARTKCKSNPLRRLH
jgi:arginine repressor